MFKKILVANRGEIAVRIIRTCREMGIQTVAVYSEPDRKSPFVYLADEAYALEGVTSQQSYLKWEKILHIAQKCGAQAIHPGYGFLSENAAFARAVQSAGLIFIGPPPEAIELMGNKTEARKLMQSHHVPTVPGTEDAIEDAQVAAKIAADIGYPILIKAAAGGGGKGMRLVQRAGEFDQALQTASREAGAAFGDASVYIEKYVEEPRHIEFQILSDATGHTIHLGERECSIQRRHQKVVEESPSALLDADLRTAMGQAAIRAAQACDYRGAGTIEFLVDKHRKFYFLEMNTRLQVEHPVTEMVSGLDLVAEQIKIAAGQPMSRRESLSTFWGHAVECRLYAENPAENFAPSPGTIEYLKAAAGPGVREDSGVTQGSEISLYYDPMISKLITWGPNRLAAIRRMQRALLEYEISGIHTTIPFLIRVMKNKDFQQGNFTTAFIADHEKELFAHNPQTAAEAAFAAAVEFISEKNRLSVHLPQNGNGSTANWKEIHRKKALRSS